MNTFPPDGQKKPGQGKKKAVTATKLKTPRAKFQDPAFQTSQGDLGVRRDITGSPIPRMVKAPTRTGDSLSHHVGKVGAYMKQSGMMG